jgi:RNA polymerase sigma-70 factor, ECF subfamily
VSAPSLSDRTSDPARQFALRRLDPTALGDHIQTLNRVARSLCWSRDEADDLVQDTFARVLGRPRLLRGISDRGYLLRALRNTHADRHRAALRQPATVPLCDGEPVAGSSPVFNATDLINAIAGAPQPYRDAVLAVDVLGLSYQQAAHCLCTCEATISSRLYRGRQHVTRTLVEPEPTSSASHPAMPRPVRSLPDGSRHGR